MSYAGETLFRKLNSTKIELLYAIDKNAISINADIDAVSPEDKLEDVNAIVVTAIAFFNEFEERLTKKMDCQILMLKDILYKELKRIRNFGEKKSETI